MLFRKSLDEVLLQTNSPPPQVYPGAPALVMTADQKISSMTWGFPLVLKGKKGQPLKPKPVNNARTDKLGSPFWSSSFKKRRCLIPVSRFAEAEGKKGAKTRTWFSLPDQDLFACAGIWRDSAEWGNCFSMVMTDAAGTVARIHNRMPVILSTDHQSSWLEGSPDDARKLCVPYAGKLKEDSTDDLWIRR